MTHQFLLKYFSLKLLGPNHGVVIVHLSFLNHGLGHVLLDVGEQLGEFGVLE
jgi:hypothetical protein